MVERFIEDAKMLSCVLKELVAEKSEGEKCNVALFEPSEDGKGDGHLYQISFVPPKTKHPLQHIVTSSKNGFFLLGKAILESDYNEDGEEEVKVALVEMTRRRTERVLVGTPISQEVFYINGSESLHQGSGTSSSGRSSISQSQSCVYDWSLTNVIALPTVSLGRARYIVSLFDYCMANGLFDNIDNVPLWVSVDEKNPRSVTHLATLIPASPSTEQRYVNHVILSCKGLFTKPEDLPDLGTIKNWHNPKCLGSLVENSSHAYALYELLGVLQTHDIDEEDQKSLAYVEFTWSDISSVLQSPPLTSDCVLHIQSIPGTMQLSALSLTMEVSKLCSFAAVMADPEQSWPELSSEVADVYSKMEKVLESLNAGELYSEATPVPDDENERSNVFSPLMQLSHQDFVPRKDLDFTESLWLVLKEAVDFSDLASSLQVALFALLNGTCQPVVHSANKTTLAVFIRELMQCETNEKRYKLRLKVEKMLDEETALKCLVEIGTEKLLRDHTNYFLSEELVTQDQLSYYMEKSVSLEEKVSRVSKLHNVLDLILTMKCIINAGHTNLQLLTQAALSYYENNESCDHPVFSISLPAYGASSTSAVKNIISTHQPSVWCLALTSKSKKGKLTSVIQLSTESPVNKMPDFDADESEINEREDLTICGTLKSKIPYYLSLAQQTLVPLLSSTQ